MGQIGGNFAPDGGSIGCPLSFSQCGDGSAIASTLDADLQAYQSKPLSDDIVFLFLDGISQKVREIGVEGNFLDRERPSSYYERLCLRRSIFSRRSHDEGNNRFFKSALVSDSGSGHGRDAVQNFYQGGD